MKLEVITFAVLGALAGTFSCVCAASAQSTPAGNDPAILVPIDAFVATVNARAPEHMCASFAPDATILDDVPPNAFPGPNACEKWYRAFVAINTAQHAVSVSLAHGSPSYEHVTGDRAYVVLPSDYTFTLEGKSNAESAAWTFALVRVDGAWKITSWSWSLLTDTSE